MTLLSPLALLLGLTAMVPLVLHLYQRRRRTVIEFSSNRFFTAAIVRAQRRLRLRRLLLLLVRVAVCALLALALARPMMKLAGFGGREGSRDIVILLDDSLSMRAEEKATRQRGNGGVRASGPRARQRGNEATRQRGNKASAGVSPARRSDEGEVAVGHATRFDHARRLALQVLNELAPGDRAAVITFTGQTIGDRTHRLEAGATEVAAAPRGGRVVYRRDAGATSWTVGPVSNRSDVELSEDLLRLLDETQRCRPTYAGGDAHTALARAAELFQDSAPRNRLVLVLSDSQAADWRPGEWPQPPHPVALAFVNPGKTTGRDTGRYVSSLASNIVADQMLLSQTAAVVGQPNLLSVRIVNYRAETTPADLVLEVDGQERIRRPIELPGQNRRVEHIPLVFDKPGEHRLVLHVACRDALAADNTLYTRVRVNPQLPVLLVNGHAEAQRGRSAAFYLRAALRAVSAESPAGARGHSVQVDTIRPADLTAAALVGYRVAVLSEVSELSVLQVEQLERFVQAGGGLAIFLGDTADRAFYNDILGNPSRPLGGLLPAQLHTLVEAVETVEPLHILAAELNHPALQPFQGTLRSALAGVSVYRVHAVQPRDAWVLAELDDGLPLLVERSYGRGRVILCTTAPHPRWTNLPLRRLFVPLCNRLVSYLAAGGTAPVEHHAGVELELLRGGWDVERPVYVRRPDGGRSRAAVKVVGADPVAYVPAEEVLQPGFYVVETSGQPTAFAVNAPRRESVPDALDLGAATELAGNWRLSVIDAPVTARGDQHGSLLSSGWLSRGVWDTLLWTVFVLLLIEPVVAGQIVRFRRARSVGTPGAAARLRQRRAG